MSTQEKEINTSGSVLAKAALISSCVLSACSFIGRNDISGVQYAKDGLLSVSRPVPDAASVSNSAQPGLGFLENTVPVVAEKNSVTIDRSARTLTFTGATGTSLSLPVEGADFLKPGTFKVIHKQRDPVWYAPDSYFTARQQEVPAEYDKERYRRGALGSLAIFFDGEQAIHSGPVWSEEVGGIKTEHSDLLNLFELLPIGTSLEIR